ncbi:heavy metal-associated isoprenylated plant protein 27-like [Ananas comosus]|uniref:Heavy metal-associated isoprenylated plant protein 26 n=1 Tax=Ananas comosus TaxID=4615 RepID=A0A199VJF2_ANACO|nr:heavy metal-associated isoprenylated plant protein 27-like [Ananas comosus]XP_020082156.1 heavy metal-associated isoprenylated plant protein 27-like [Ananas comosus]OAY77138.1 Heavy metal-associated isoprenylated plant protein 26 [Ananas comosus]
MGVMEGVIDYLSELCEGPISRIKKRRKPKQLQTVAMKVRIDCQGCQRKIKNALKAMKGVTSVEVNAKQNKVTVTGYVEARKVMERLAQRTGKKVEPWPYVPYEMVPHPYAPGVYDKKAPPGYVRGVALVDPDAAPLARASSLEEKYVSAFSDENPNACALM